jgi:hypothetical protein
VFVVTVAMSTSPYAVVVYVYVLMNCEWREGAEVAGVGDDLSTAMRLAQRKAEADRDPTITGWTAWAPAETNGADRVIRWRRDALNTSGEIHVSVYQEIVRARFEVMEQASAAAPTGIGR